MLKKYTACVNFDFPAWSISSNGFHRKIVIICFVVFRGYAGVKMNIGRETKQGVIGKV